MKTGGAFRESFVRFGRDRQGVAAIEFAIVAPVVVLLLLGAVVYFIIGRDDYRAKRATYTASDMISRQTTVTNAFLANAKAMSEHIASANAKTVGFRASSISRAGDAYLVNWSYATTPYSKLLVVVGSGLSLPEIALGESVIVVETSLPYQPVFSLFGSATKTHVNVSIALPRSASQVSKSD
jgi:Flp pilus assembly protein TadG